ncbi:restriction endonuclease subunit S [Vibrio nigripulchritudo]|uniref:restriction endonuclease subunit S n=1 Tax=Vibrio nigripulchritudo TaxID=28173 RepID=UPI0008DCFF0B|nr:restriction endonuclease subunit S [Vibrio nigripulchritudo]
MRSNYKKLGQFIKEVSVKNKDLSVELLLGVSITKQFIPSIANTVGTDMSKYKVVEHHQFAYGPVTSRNGEKISVALLSEEKCIVSTSYTVFEIVDTELLDPEYLMMWFRRSEFDRYARYMSHGTVRELFGWQEMCDVELPVPSIEKQREIVREYNVVNDRIALNEQLTQKLEDTAQALYKQWFVDFEFPISKEYAESIGKPELEGKPYKSSGGEMEFCSLLDMEKPIGFKTDHIESYVKLTQGQVINAKTNYLIESSGIPLLRIQDLKSHEEHIFINPSVAASKIADMEDIIVSRTGNVGLTFRHRRGVVHNNCFKVRSINEQLTSDFLFWFLKSKNVERQMRNLASGSVQADLSHQKFHTLPILLPTIKSQEQLSAFLNTIETKAENYLKLSSQLSQLKDLILRKMSKA